MATKKRSISIVENSRVSRSIKKTPNCKTSPGGKPCCPSCGLEAGNSVDYEEGVKKGEVIFYYRCKDCGQTYRRTIDIRSI